MAVALILFTFIFPICSTISILLFGPIGVFSAILSSVEFANTLSTMVTMLFFLPRLHRASFDAVVELEGDVGLLRLKHALDRTERHRNLLTVARIIKHKLVPFILRELTFSLMNLIPIVGPPLVIYLRAPGKGYKTHRKYFKWVKWNELQIKAFYQAHKGDYTGFGIVCLLLEMIPGPAVVFMFTGNIGMGLWTVENHHTFEAEASIKSDN